MSDSEPTPISPELALVAPDLAAEARAALPDRPWEAFAPPRPAPQLRVTRVVAAVPAPPPSPPPPDRRRRVVTGGRLVLVAAIALLAASFLPRRDAPRLVTDSTLPARATSLAVAPRLAVPPADPGCAPTSTPRDPFRPVCPPAARARSGSR